MSKVTGELTMLSREKETDILRESMHSYITSATDEHGNDSGPEMQIGDLLEVTKSLLNFMTKEQIISLVDDSDFMESCSYFDRDAILEVIQENGETSKKGKINIEMNVDEDEQSSSFQNATIQSATDELAISVAAYPNFHGETSQESIVESFASEVLPLVQAGWSFEIKIGKACE